MAWAIAGGTFLKMGGSLQEGREEERRYEFDAESLEKQSKLLLAGAENKLEVGRIAQFEMEREKGYALGSMEAGRGKAGIAFAGSAATSSTRLEARLNERSWRAGKQTMFEYGQEKEQSQILLTQAFESRRRGKYARKQSYWDAASDLLTGAKEMRKSGYI